MSTRMVDLPIRDFAGRALQRGDLTIFFGPDDTVLWATVNPVSQELEKLLYQAAQGDPEAQFRLGQLTGDRSLRPNAWKWMCLAANQGHAKAQHELGIVYWRGVEPFEQDTVRAYMWYSLAASNGYGYSAAHNDLVAAQMTAEQIAEAERLVEEWEPGECEPEHGATTAAG